MVVVTSHSLFILNYVITMVKYGIVLQSHSRRLKLFFFQSQFCYEIVFIDTSCYNCDTKQPSYSFHLMSSPVWKSTIYFLSFAGGWRGRFIASYFQHLYHRRSDRITPRTDWKPDLRKNNLNLSFMLLCFNNHIRARHNQYTWDISSKIFLKFWKECFRKFWIMSLWILHAS